MNKPSLPPKRSPPLGQITRGKTAPNRLRQTDVFLALAYTEQVKAARGLYVDLGYGAYPVTTRETWQRLTRLNPALRVVGVEIDPARMAEAAPFARPGLEFRFGGFNLPLQSKESVSFIRAFNVLRQYSEADVSAALTTLTEPLNESGLIIEGTCDPPGRLLTFNLYQKSGGRLERRMFVFAPRLSTVGPQFQPRAFQAVLPKNLIHHAEPGGTLDSFFGAWHKAWQQARARASGLSNVFANAAERLSETYGYEVDRRPSLLKRGFLCLGPTWPEPRS
jgi:hypothetical protein